MVGLLRVDPCVVCRRPATFSGRLSDSFTVLCELCGSYVISGQLATIISLEEPDGLRPYLICHLRQANEPTILGTDWRALAEPHSRTTVPQKFERLMKHVASKSRDIGTRVELGLLDYPLFDLVEFDGLSALVEYGLLSVEKGMDGHDVRLTVKGWDYVGLADKSGRPGTVFVAMSYHSDLDAAYRDGIEAAIRDCGLEPRRVDKIHHEENVNDRMLAEIRGCQVFVGDFTQQRAGVYFEAGFALALGKTVVWTCHKDDLENLHFDTRQYPHIAWTDPADLRQQLVDRLRALIQLQ